ncbi:GDSL esterase/lipase 5, partial [Cucurbita argyrosperma subsp. sororia]
MSCHSPHSCKPLPKQELGPLFIFGDSLYDVGNNNYMNTTAVVNFQPYGQTFFKFPTGRFCDGREIPDFIAEYAGLPLILPYLYPGIKDFVKGVNFASGGARALDETFSESGFIYSHADFHTAMNRIIDHPSKYGMKEVMRGCCGIGPLRGTNSCGGQGDIKEYVFFDATHLTHTSYELIAEMMWSGSSNITTPLTLKSLFYA